MGELTAPASAKLRRRRRAAVRRTEGRGAGGDVKQTLDPEFVEALPDGRSALLEIAQALQELAAIEPRLAPVVEMRCFAEP